MSRATVSRLFTAGRSPPVTADDFLRGTSRSILTARRYFPVISDGLMFPAAASFARKAPSPGPPANLLAAALATPLPRTQAPLPPSVAVSARQPPLAGPSADLLAAAWATPLPCTPSPVVAAVFAHQLPHAGPLAKLLAALLPPPPLCPRSLSTAAAPSFACQSPPAGPPVTLLVDALAAPRLPPGARSLGRCISRDCSSPGLPFHPADAAAPPYVCYYHKRFGTAACHCCPPCSWLALQGCPRPLAAQLAGGHLILRWDSISSQDLLVDSGSSYSLLPHQSTAQPSGPLLCTTDGAPLPT